MRKSDSINELASALAKAQGDIKAAVKSAENPFFKSSYANLNSVWEVCRAPLSKNGLCVMQTLDRDETGHFLLTTLAHASGQWIESRIYLNPKANDPQAVGSAITYYRRYALQALVGVATEEDDDGEGAMSRPQPEKKPQGPSAPSHQIRNVTQVKTQGNRQ